MSGIGPWAVIAHWSETNESPPIGPFETYTEASKFATELRKRMWSAGYKRRPYQVRITIMASPEQARCWSSLSE